MDWVAFIEIDGIELVKLFSLEVDQKLRKLNLPTLPTQLNNVTTMNLSSTTPFKLVISLKVMNTN